MFVVSRSTSVARRFSADGMADRYRISNQLTDSPSTESLHSRSSGCPNRRFKPVFAGIPLATPLFQQTRRMVTAFLHINHTTLTPPTQGYFHCLANNSRLTMLGILTHFHHHQCTHAGMRVDSRVPRGRLRRQVPNPAEPRCDARRSRGPCLLA